MLQSRILICLAQAPSSPEEVRAGGGAAVTAVAAAHAQQAEPAPATAAGADAALTVPPI